MMKHISIITAIIMLVSLITHNIDAQISFTITPQQACTGSAVEFTNTTSGNNKFAHFDFGDGTESYGNNLQHAYTQKGEYTVTMWILNNDNTKTEPISKTVTIDDTPSIEIADDKAMSQITVTTDQEVDYQWTKDNNQLKNNDNPLFYYESGTYSVTITNSSGCTATAEISVTTTGEKTFDNTIIKVVNNVITAGIKDGINDMLYIENITEFQYPCSVLIYNKQGKLVYSNTAYTNTDGFQGNDNDGNELFAGTYYYVIKSQGRKGTTGFIDLIR